MFVLRKSHTLCHIFSFFHRLFVKKQLIFLRCFYFYVYFSYFYFFYCCFIFPLLNLFLFSQLAFFLLVVAIVIVVSLPLSLELLCGVVEKNLSHGVVRKQQHTTEKNQWSFFFLFHPFSLLLLLKAKWNHRFYFYCLSLF